MQGPTLCAQCDLPEDRCTCERYCTICKGQVKTCAFAPTVLFYLSRLPGSLRSLSGHQPWQLNPKALLLYIDADARLAAAAGGVVRYLADAAGLQKRRRRSIAICRHRCLLGSFSNI